MSKSKVSKEVKVERKDHHHLGSPNMLDTFYSKDNCEYTILLSANGSNTHFMENMDVQNDDILQIGMSEQDFEMLAESMMSTISDRLKEKLTRFNEYKKTYYTTELEGTEKEFEKSQWNSFRKW